MGFNFGTFAGGLAEGGVFGLNTGMRMSDYHRQRSKEERLAQIHERGMQEARAAREQAVEGLIKDRAPEVPTSGPIDTKVALTPQQVSESSPTANPDAAAAKTSAFYMAPESITPSAKTGEATEPTPQTITPQSAAAKGVTTGPGFWVNGKQYASREEARAAAEKEAPDPMHFFMKNAVPKIAEEYAMVGHPEKAKAWLDEAESYNGKRAIKAWASAINAPDFDTAASRFGEYYTNFIDDGVDYTGHKMLTKDDGTQVAVVTLKDRASGKEQQMELTADKMIQLGASYNPQTLFESKWKQQQEADKLKFQSALKARERREKLEDDMTNESFKADLQDRRESLKQDRLDKRERIKAEINIDSATGKQQREIDTKIDALVGAGYSEDDIKKMMPSIVGAGDHKKTTDPAERRAIIASDLMKNDPSFARKPKDQQNKQIDDMMGVIYGDGEKPQAKSGIADKPMAFDPKLPIKYRKSDGKPFHLIDGQYVPIEGPVTPQAGGMPAR